MRERPILFSGPMVCAILGGAKTQTRRPVKQVPHWDHCGKDIMEWGLSDCYTDDDGRHWLDIQTDVDDNSHEEISCPYGRPGDRLWVREPGRVAARTQQYDAPGLFDIQFAAGGVKHRVCLPDRLLRGGQPPSWWVAGRGIPNGIFREAARIWLKIVSVRVERLCDISIADAQAEGFSGHGAIIPFIQTWERMYGNRGLGCDVNPWLWVVEFKRAEASA